VLLYHSHTRIKKFKKKSQLVSLDFSLT